MALTTIADRPLLPGSVATQPTQAKLSPEEMYLQEHVALGLPSYDDYLRDCATWYIGWEILNRSGYGRELWLGAGVLAAISEWDALWSGAPCVAIPRPTLQHIASSDVYTPEWAARLAASLEDTSEDPPVDPGEPPSPAPAPPPVMPQDLQSSGETFICGRNAASVIAATAEKLSATPDNIQAAAKAKANGDDPDPDSTPEAEAWLDRFLEDVLDGVVDFEQRKNKHNVVLIRTRIWLRKGSHDVYLERDGLAQGVIVCTQAPTGTWVPTVRRDEVRDWLKLKPGKSASEAAAENSPTKESLHDLVGSTQPVNEIGEFAKNRKDAA